MNTLVTIIAFLIAAPIIAAIYFLQFFIPALATFAADRLVNGRA